MTAGNQRESARLAFDRLASIAEKHELNIPHGNGEQIGLLGMIGHLVEQELGNQVPLDKSLASLLTTVDKDRPSALLARGAMCRGSPGPG